MIRSRPIDALRAEHRSGYFCDTHGPIGAEVCPHCGELATPGAYGIIGYTPTADLSRRFADLNGTEDMLEWANAYGLLTSTNWDSGERLDLWEQSIFDMKVATSLADLSPRKLAPLVGGVSSEKIVVRLPFDPSQSITEVAVGLPKTPKAQVRRVLLSYAQRGLTKYPVHLHPVSDGKRIRMVEVASCLLGSMWSYFAQSLTEDAPLVVRCDACKEWFTRTINRGGEAYCSQRCRKRAQRKRDKLRKHR